MRQHCGLPPEACLVVAAVVLLALVGGKAVVRSIHGARCPHVRLSNIITRPMLEPPIFKFRFSSSTQRDWLPDIGSFIHSDCKSRGRCPVVTLGVARLFSAHPQRSLWGPEPPRLLFSSCRFQGVSFTVQQARTSLCSEKQCDGLGQCENHIDSRLMIVLGRPQGECRGAVVSPQGSLHVSGSM